MRTGTARCICCKHSLPLTRTPSTNHCQHTDLRAHGKLFPQLPAVCCQEQRNTLTHYVSQHRHKQRGSIFSRRRQGLTACTCAQRQMELAPQEPAHTQSRTLKYTPYEGNSWQVTFPQSGVTVLVDPWLEGDLVFAKQTWLYRGQKGALAEVQLDIDAIGAKADLILLSQGLDDHAHKPTLERLPKDKLVVGSPAAAAVAQELGYTNVKSVDHGQLVSICDGQIEIEATAGALVGPPWSKRENGFVIRETAPGGVKLYYEPHCDYDEASVAKIGKVDVIVTPANSQVLVNFPLVKGKQNALKLVQALQPSVVIPLINAEFKQSGPLSMLIHAEGRPEDLQYQLQQQGMQRIRVQMPASPGEAIDIAV